MLARGFSQSLRNLVGSRGRYEKWIKKRYQAAKVVLRNADSTKKIRPAVVTILGHVDHGKTTLMERLSQMRLLGTEKDTPGHMAFASMRGVGTQCTDLALLIVAADDGVMPQTEESIKYIKRHNVPVIVVINKIDKAPNNDVQEELSYYGIVVEDLGGQVQCISISAKECTNIDSLLDAIVAECDMMALEAKPDVDLKAIVIESRTVHGKGKMAVCLVKEGTLNRGDTVWSGDAYAFVKRIEDDLGEVSSTLTPGCVGDVYGWNESPNPGHIITRLKSKSLAKEMYRKYSKEYTVETSGSSNSPAEADTVDGITALPIILKADTEGSLDAVVSLLGTYNDSLCRLDIIRRGVGDLSLNDTVFASSFNGIIYLYNSKVPEDLRERIPAGVAVRRHDIVYHLAEDVMEEMNRIVPPVLYHEVVGRAIVQKVFDVTENRKKVKVFGCVCISGSIRRSARFKIFKSQSGQTAIDTSTTRGDDGEALVANVTCNSLRNFKSNVEEIPRNVEFGIMLQSQDATWTPLVEPGDAIVCYEQKYRKQAVHWDIFSN